MDLIFFPVSGACGVAAQRRPVASWIDGLVGVLFELVLTPALISDNGCRFPALL